MAAGLRLGVTGAGLVTSSLVLLRLSHEFAYDSDPVTRPILAVVVVLSVMFILHLIGLHAGLRMQATRSTLLWISGVAVMMRVVVLSGDPIQEVDLYRYLWDGQVAIQGISPYRHPPADILGRFDDAKKSDHRERSDPVPDELVRLCTRDVSVHEILRRVHFGELTTVYPPVSQLVFASVAVAVPTGATVAAHVLVMKSVLCSFDLGTMVLLLLLLRRLERPVHWLIAYGWNPLIVKEFANSGHLDSIAVFFTTAAVLMLLQSLRCRDVMSVRRSTILSSLASASLAFGFAAKLYPIVLIPLFFFSVVKTAGFGAGLRLMGTFAVVSGTLTSPLWMTAVLRPNVASSVPHMLNVRQSPEATTPGTPTRETLPTRQASRLHGVIRKSRSESGFQAFFTRWEMNDVPFMLLHENLTPRRSANASPWVRVVPYRFTESLDSAGFVALGLPVRMTGFLLSRLLTLVIFGILLTMIVLRVVQEGPEQLPRGVFLTIAVFWLLSPTMNPWYWSWALPFLPFARLRSWLLVSGLLPLYYLRFWFLYHLPDWDVAGFPGGGRGVFDFGIVFVEHLPWLVCVAAEAAWRATRARSFGRSDAGASRWAT